MGSESGAAAQGGAVPPFAKVLIANRGEIAVRVAQTCREMGIRTVAVFSTADAGALHVRVADEAMCIGPPPPLESYLSIPAIVRAALESGAEAVHPGYGFLAENADFARAVQNAGLVWIGPPPGVIARMGDKVAAKDLARSAGVPVVPGYDGEDQSVEIMLEEAGRIGYPVILKAAAGGGGKGMRSVANHGELPAALESARREARSAFGDDRIFIEKFIADPRHIEIQVFADNYGNGLYLGERDCSLQRRHQKVVEEAPSPILTVPLRTAMGEAALRLVRASSYVNAGTVEFLFSGDSFYFLEMNTRIQVEHPVTELVTGLDLVRLQLEVASGARLPFGQLDVALDGHAVEARIYAEDARTGFLPSTGVLEVFSMPSGPGVRNDAGVVQGSEVSPYYDPMLAKLVVHAETRSAAVERLARALSDYAVLGVTSNVEFLRWIAGSDRFRVGNYDIGFIESEWKPEEQSEAPDEVFVAAALYLALQGTGARSDRDDAWNPWARGGGWRPFGLASTQSFQQGDRRVSVRLERDVDGGWRAETGGSHWSLDATLIGANRLELRGGDLTMSFELGFRDSRLGVLYQGVSYALEMPEPSSGSHRPEHAGGGAGAIAPMPGTVVKVLVNEGQYVAAREPLMILEAMKMEHVVEAPGAGTVRAILFREGDMVPAGSALVQVQED